MGEVYYRVYCCKTCLLQKWAYRGVIALVVTWRRRSRRPEVEEMPNSGLRKHRRHGLRQLRRLFFCNFCEYTLLTVRLRQNKLWQTEF
jgi:hypothetical protein